jgi:PrtD family type I secretion system ABC transporter
MRSSRRLLKQARRAVLAAFLFTGCINTLMLATPLFTLQIFETVVPTGSVETLVVLALMAGAAIVSLAGIEICRDRMLLRAGLWLDHVLGEHMLEHGLKRGADGGELRTEHRALAQLRSFLTGPGVGAIFDVPWVPAFLVLMVLLHPMIGGVAAVAALGLASTALLHALVTNRALSEGSRALERAGDWWATVTERSGLVGALGLTAGAAAHWERFNRSHVASAYAHGKRTSFLKAIARTIRLGSQIALYGVGGWLIVRGELAPGALVASALMLAKVLGPLEQAVSGLKAAETALAAYRRLKALPPEVEVPAVGAEDAIEGRITLTDVSYFHPGRRVPALRGITLSLAPGQCLGIVGPNGAGKSTLAAILAGALAPHSGAAELDGIAIAKWQRGEGSPPIGYLPDDPHLIEGSVHDNISRFSGASLASVGRAAIEAGVHETLAALPQGYDTEAGPRGSALSLRERRAVALARALHARPRIVVLDEPELGLDGASLKRLQRLLAELKAAGTAIVVATQDPRLLGVVDMVAVIAEGALQAFGPTAEVATRMGQARTAAQPVH